MMAKPIDYGDVLDARDRYIQALNHGDPKADALRAEAERLYKEFFNLAMTDAKELLHKHHIEVV
jgi:hypothetical protein